MRYKAHPQFWLDRGTVSVEGTLMAASWIFPPSKFQEGGQSLKKQLIKNMPVKHAFTNLVALLEKVQKLLASQFLALLLRRLYQFVYQLSECHLYPSHSKTT